MAVGGKAPGSAHTGSGGTKKAAPRKHKLIRVREETLTKLQAAAKAGATLLVESLLPTLTARDINWIGKGTHPALTWAAKRGHVDVVRLLVNNPKTEVNAADRYGETALIYAAWRGRLGVVRVLLEHPKVDLNNTKFGWEDTALMRAAENGHFEVVRLLVEKGADVHCTDNQGFTALSGAARNGHAEIVTYLVNTGGAQICPSYSDLGRGFDDDSSRDALVLALRDARGVDGPRTVRILMDAWMGNVGTPTWTQDEFLESMLGSSTFSTIEADMLDVFKQACGTEDPDATLTFGALRATLLRDVVWSWRRQGRLHHRLRHLQTSWHILGDPNAVLDRVGHPHVEERWARHHTTMLGVAVEGMNGRMVQALLLQQADLHVDANGLVEHALHVSRLTGARAEQQPPFAKGTYVWVEQGRLISRPTCTWCQGWHYQNEGRRAAVVTKASHPMYNVAYTYPTETGPPLVRAMTKMEEFQNRWRNLDVNQYVTDVLAPLLNHNRGQRAPGVFSDALVALLSTGRYPARLKYTLALVQRLLQAGADPNAEPRGPHCYFNYKGYSTYSLPFTPLLWATLRKDVAVVAALLAAGADVNHMVTNGHGRFATALYVALIPDDFLAWQSRHFEASEQYQVVGTLLAHGAWYGDEYPPGQRDDVDLMLKYEHRKRVGNVGAALEAIVAPESRCGVPTANLDGAIRALYRGRCAMLYYTPPKADVMPLEEEQEQPGKEGLDVPFDDAIGKDDSPMWRVVTRCFVALEEGTDPHRHQTILHVLLQCTSAWLSRGEKFVFTPHRTHPTIHLAPMRGVGPPALQGAEIGIVDKREVRHYLVRVPGNRVNFAVSHPIDYEEDDLAQRRHQRIRDGL